MTGLLTAAGVRKEFGGLIAVNDVDFTIPEKTIVSLIGATRSRSGLRIRSELDRGCYPSGVTVTDAQLATVRLERHRFHGDWNYTIHPATTQ